MVISANGSGLCNRIKSLLSAMRIAEYMNDNEIKVAWPKKQGVISDCNFNDIFENENMLLKKEDNTNGAVMYNLWRFAIMPDDLIPDGFSDGTGIRYYDRKKFDKHSHTRPDGKNIDGEYDRIPEEVRKKYLKHISTLKVNKDILHEVDVFSKKFDNNTISVQIRSWNDDDYKKNFFDINDFYQVMDSMSEETTFFLTADVPDVVDMFIDRYGDRIIVRPTNVDIGTRDNKQGIIDAMIDLLLLSKNKILIGTYISTFTEVAWWYSGCKSKVIIL